MLPSLIPLVSPCILYMQHKVKGLQPTFRWVCTCKLSHHGAVLKYQPRKPEAVKACWADAASRQSSQGKRLHHDDSQSAGSLSCTLHWEQRQAALSICWGTEQSWSRSGFCRACRVPISGHSCHKWDKSFLPLLVWEIWADKNFLGMTVGWGWKLNGEDGD